MLDKSEKLKQVLELLNNNLSRKEFISAFEKVTKYAKDLEPKLLNKVSLKIIDEEKRLITAFNDKLSRVLGQYEQTVSKGGGDIEKLKSSVTEAINDFNLKSERKWKEIDKRMSLVKDGKPADEVKIISEVLKRIPPPKVDDSKIKALEKELEALREIVRHRGGGGTSAMGVAQAMKRILKTEAPVGLINGSNTQYTVSQTIFAVLAFSLNGEVIAQLPNYTISGKTITFSTALPAAYSGKDFEIKYV